MKRISRRTVLLATTGIGVAAAVPAIALLATGPEDVVARIVRLRFPGVAIAPDDLRAFARDFLVSDRTSGAKLAAIGGALEQVGRERELGDDAPLEAVIELLHALGCQA